MKLPRNDVTSVPGTLATLPEAKPPQRSWHWKNSALVLIWHQMTCWFPRQFGGKCLSANPCQWRRSAAFISFMALLASQSALNVERLWNGNTSLTVTAVGNAWIGKTSPKQPFCCLRNNTPWYISSYLASAFYHLAALGMPFFFSSFSPFPLLTFYLQTLQMSFLSYPFLFAVSFNSLLTMLYRFYLQTFGCLADFGVSPVPDRWKRVGNINQGCKWPPYFAGGDWGKGRCTPYRR